MPLESASTILQLDPRWPTSQDSATRGDDHLRMIKQVLKNQFPGIAGSGFAKPITISEDYLNSVPDKIEQLKQKRKKVFSVGSVVARMDSRNPADIYEGSWSRINGNASLKLGNGRAQSGRVVGSDVKGVPLQRHSHGAGHNLRLNPGGAHNHGLTLVGQSGRDANQRQSASWCFDRLVNGTQRTAYTAYAGNHSHPLSGGVTIDYAGTANASINVAGARVAINFWKRTS